MKKREKFRHLTGKDRDRIHALYGHGHSQVDIGKVLGVNKGTISRELRRYDKKNWRYSSTVAQKDADMKRAKSKRPGMKIKVKKRLKQFIIKELKHLRSPDEIAGRMKRDGMNPRVGTAAIYKWLYSEDGKPYCEEIIPNKRSSSIVPAMQTATLHADTCTLDNGIENIHHKEFGVEAYFCDPGNPTQKPRVEGGIGLIRRWFIPKGTNLATIFDDTYQSQLHLLNYKHRKSLGYLSAYEYAKERGIITHVPRISLREAVALR